MSNFDQLEAQLAALNHAMAPGEVDAAINTATDAINELAARFNDQNTRPELVKREADLVKLVNDLNFILSAIKGSPAPASSRFALLCGWWVA